MTLAFAAGMLNAWTLANTQTFATVQSGNIVSLGYFLVLGDVSRVLIATVSVAAFLVGACGSSLLVAVLARDLDAYSVRILAIEAGLLATAGGLSLVPGMSPWWIAWMISFVAGIQGNAFHRESGLLYGNVAVTFVLQMAGSLLGRAIGHRIASDGQPHLAPAGGYLLVLVAFAAGGGAGAALDGWWPAASVFCAVVALLGLAAVAGAHKGAVDPGQNAPTP